jgi:hypothetical protein
VIDHLDHGARASSRAFAALRPVFGHRAVDAEFSAQGADDFVLGRGVGGQVVDRNGDWDAELAEVADVPPEVHAFLAHRGAVLT